MPDSLLLVGYTVASVYVIVRHCWG